MTRSAGAMKVPASDTFSAALDTATTAPPAELRSDLLSALKHYRDGNQAAVRVVRQQRDAAQRIVKANRHLELELRRASAAFGLTPPPPWVPAEWTSFLPYAWRDLDTPLAELTERIEAWLAATTPPKTGRGGPHHGRFHLRIRTFEALRRHGIRISAKGDDSPAARALAVVLAEADRIDGKAVKGRNEFNSKQWARWVKEYRQIEVSVFNRGENSGLNRAHLLNLIRYLKPPTS